MGTPIVLWIKLSPRRPEQSLVLALANECEFHYLNNVEAIPAKVSKVRPHLLCFDYDYPDQEGLRALRETKRQFPSLPILMITQPNSEALAVWALRARVWDYLVKPVDPEALLARIRILARFPQKSEAEQRQNSMPDQAIPEQLGIHRKSTSHLTYAAITYVQNHYHEKILLDEAATRCGMQAGSFSRQFKRENEITFRDYLMGYRINKAVELLQYSSANILDVALIVGFSDPSQFARMFKRHTGLTPSSYRGSKFLSGTDLSD